MKYSLLIYLLHYLSLTVGYPVFSVNWISGIQHPVDTGYPVKSLSGTSLLWKKMAATETSHIFCKLNYKCIYIYINIYIQVAHTYLNISVLKVFVRVTLQIYIIIRELSVCVPVLPTRRISTATTPLAVLPSSAAMATYEANDPGLDLQNW